MEAVSGPFVKEDIGVISINANMGGMRAMDGLQQSHRVLQTALERLSTGIRINRAEDDAAGLMVRDRFQAQVNGFEEGIRNIQTAQGMVQVAEQGLNKVTEALQQMRALAVRAADDNLNDEDRGRIQEQVKGLLKEINERAASTSYNGHRLLDGSIADSREERVGQLKTQSQSFLSDGKNLIRSGSTTGTAATTANAISQGSYQVRLVYTGEHGVRPSATSLTALKGTLNSGANGDGSADVSTLNQIVTDRNGAAHTASFTFTQVGDGSRNFNYEVNIAAGGVYDTAQTFTGTVSFNDDGTIKAVDNHAPSIARSVTLSDGTSDGQDWSIDFSGLVENQHTHATSLFSDTAAQTGTDVGTVRSNFSGNMNGNLLNAQTQSAIVSWVDYAGTSHNVDILFTKFGNSFGVGQDAWTWNVDTTDLTPFGAGGATVTGGSASGNIFFFANATTATGSFTITDANGQEQSIFLDFTGLTNNTTSGATAAEASQATATTNSIVTGNLDEGRAAGYTHPITASWVDSAGASQTASIDFTKTVENGTGNGSDTWSWTVSSVSGAVINGSNTGSLDFSAMTTGHLINVTDTAGNTYEVNFDFSGLTNIESGASATNNGVEGTESSTMTATGNLDSDHVISDSVTTTAFNVVDRTGAEHSVSISYTKLDDTAAGETWSYAINGLDGGVWNGATSGNASGTLEFSSAGALLAINGGSPSAFSLRIDDGTSNGQSLSVSLTAMTNTNAADSQAGTANGAQGSPTTDVTLHNNLSNGISPNPVRFSLVDRTGQDTSTGTITFSQTSEDSQTWNYTISAPSEAGVDGYNGFGSNLQGTVEFDAAGNLIKLDGSTALAKDVTFNDRTGEQHVVGFDFSQLNYAAADDFTDSISDGGSGLDQGEVAAVIYYSDGTGSTDVNPVCTLDAVDIEAKTYSAGGVSFTVEQASTLDVGLTAYLKAYTYISATQDDRSLTFQVGPDEGNVTRVGISRMDVDTIFRRNGPDGGASSFTDVELTNALKAQDLIGQIDDALNFVGGENLKVGQFQNKFGRTLDLARQQMTSITGALSNLNDADMAKEATNQSKRSILVQSATAMVAQANSQGQFLLQLLR